MKKKKITLLAVVLATAAMFTGCTIEDEYVPVDTEAYKLWKQMIWAHHHYRRH